MFSVSELHNSSQQYHYLFKFHGIICWYIVPYFLQKKIVLLPTKCKIRPFVRHQKDANIHWSVPTSLYDPVINLYTSVVHFYQVSLARGTGPLKGPFNETRGKKWPTSVKN